MRKLTMLVAATAAALALLAGVGSAATISPEYVPGFDDDAGVSTSAAPATAVVGDFALLSSLVTNHGRNGSSIDFTDVVPNGFTINAATAGSGTCVSSGQNVACRLVLDPGESAPVNVVVTPTAPGSYTNKVSVTAPERDTNPIDNSATSVLAVAAATPPAQPPTCTVPLLKRTPLGVAKRVLGLLHCKAGKAKRVHSRAIAKGQVIRTTPRPGTYKRGRAVALTVSSGPPQRRAR